MTGELPLYEGDDFVELRGRVVAVNACALYLAGPYGFSVVRVDKEFINLVSSDELVPGKEVSVFVLEGHVRKLGLLAEKRAQGE